MRCVLARIAKSFGVTAARAAMGVVAVSGLGLPVARAARALGVTPMPLLRGVRQGRMLLEIRKLDLESLAREAQEGEQG